MRKEMDRYKIIRFFAPHLKRKNKVMDTGLTLEEAQEHCSDPDSKSAGVFFDGYEKE
jgi:hypothetical protein